jgi:hypothetical protein
MRALMTSSYKPCFVTTGLISIEPPAVPCCDASCTAENSASLADALRAVMAARREQDNFQLIVITHDEHFAHQIGELRICIRVSVLHAPYRTG